MPTPLSKIPVVGPVAEVATDLAVGVAKLPAAAADKAATQVRSGVTLGRLAVEGTARSLVGKVTGRSGAPEAPAKAPTPAPAPAAPVTETSTEPSTEPVTDIDAGAADVEVDATPADVAAFAGKKSPARKTAAKKAAPKKAAAKKAAAKKPAPTKTADQVPLKSEPTPSSAAPPEPEGPEQLELPADAGTEPLVDTATAKQVASESETLQQASDS
ncbi:hypothetical protein BKA08_003321 [Nocardioides marinisabuli]|uniref:Uncharacterized protein n=1 Tax=Nocardioides marinisabuli TaxID=419476 RepID=A0A7Y9F3S8_9ACTN|nr:hypothetical protein [Nocardioides marinisabuli]NYD59083.1 hypothetical protein [Nocardioides marinisabuli]